MTKIFYVEDEPFLGKIVRESLESRRFEVLLVEDGGIAMREFARFQPDICVLDVMLPHRDGFSLAREIRRSDPRIPIIFLTAKSQTDDVLQGFESGGNDYLRKPFSMEELIVRIQNLLRMTQGVDAPSRQNPGAYTLGRYLFDPIKLLLTLGEEERRLSHREGQLLEIIAGRPGETISRQEILQHVWGNDSYFNSRNLDVYVTRLREYLREDDSVQILTLKGVGYRLVCS